MENQQPSQNQDKGTKQKSATIIGILLGIAVVLFVVNGILKNKPADTTNLNVGITNTNQPEVITSDVDTSDWKTYRNEEYGYSIRYPQNLFTLDNIINPEYTLDPKNVRLFNIPSSLEVKKCQCGEAIIISIAVQPNSDHLSLDEYFKQKYDSEFLLYKKFEEFKNKPAMSFADERESYILIDRGDDVLELTWSGGDFSKIIDSIEFLN